MMDVANVFILALLGGAAWLGVSALVRKLFTRRRKGHRGSKLAA